MFYCRLWCHIRLSDLLYESCSICSTTLWENCLARPAQPSRTCRQKLVPRCPSWGEVQWRIRRRLVIGPEFPYQSSIEKDEYGHICQISSDLNKYEICSGTDGTLWNFHIYMNLCAFLPTYLKKTNLLRDVLPQRWGNSIMVGIFKHARWFLFWLKPES